MTHGIELPNVPLSDPRCTCLLAPEEPCEAHPVPTPEGIDAKLEAAIELLREADRDACSLRGSHSYASQIIQRSWTDANIGRENIRSIQQRKGAA